MKNISIIKNVQKYFLSFITFIFPARVITTFFGIGYLPDWQAHWAAFFSIPFIGLIIHFAIGLNSSVFEVALALIIASTILFFVGLVSIFLFHASNANYTKYEITIHIVFGQTLMIFLSIPAILQFTIKISGFNTFICTQFLFCATWFFYVVTYFVAMLVPYFAFRIIDILKPWPSYILDRDYDHCFIYMLEAFFNAIYAAILIYLIAFLVLDLNIMTVISFYTSLFTLNF